MHPANAFITLTYNDEHLPDDYSVNLRTVQLFMKRLRKELGSKIRFYACGEYGDENSRPHYHALIFGHDFASDRKLYKQTPKGPLYVSTLLEKTWPFGFNTVADVTPATCNYVSQYIQKKIGGDMAAAHYERMHPKGYIVQVAPEFATRSVKPGIGATWYAKYKSDCFPSDFLVVDGKQKSVPTYYLNKLQAEDATNRAPEAEYKLRKTSKEPANKIKRQRTTKSIATRDNATPERLAVREFIRKDKLTRSKRTL